MFVGAGDAEAVLGGLDLPSDPYPLVLLLFLAPCLYAAASVEARADLSLRTRPLQVPLTPTLEAEEGSGVTPPLFSRLLLLLNLNFFTSVSNKNKKK